MSNCDGDCYLCPPGRCRRDPIPSDGKQQPPTQWDATSANASGGFDPINRFFCICATGLVALGILIGKLVFG